MIGLLVLQPSLLATSGTALVVLVYGTGILYLAGVLRIIYHRYPEAEHQLNNKVELKTDQAMLLLMCLFMILLERLKNT